MSEKRKPSHTILLKKQGKKTNKMELFTAHTMGESYELKRYRVRINGRWWPKGAKGKERFFNMTQIKELTFRSTFFKQ